MKFIWSILTTFSFLFLIIIIMSYGTRAKAQIVGPFPESPTPGVVVERPLNVRCMPTKSFLEGAKIKGLKIIAFNAISSPIIKMIFMNKEGEIAIINSLPDNSICILDIYTTDTQYSQELRFNRPTTEINE